jgi:hypothetical protein
MPTTLTARDTEILTALTRHVRVFSLSQIATTWWATSSARVAENRLKQLATLGLIQIDHTVAHPELELPGPLFTWHPGEADPHLGALSHALRSLFGAPKGGNVIHAAQAEEDPTVFRLFIPEPDTSLDRYVTTLKRAAHQACTDEKLLRWIERGTYQFAVLLTNEGRVEKLAELIRANDFPDLRIHLEIAPSPRDLPLFITPDKEGN